MFILVVKPLYYGAFGSYAPSYDSTFANLSKEESQLLFQTYGDETAVQYAERYNIDIILLPNFWNVWKSATLTQKAFEFW